jgi:3-deoxy-D-manno-octulosonate 8-phosphate phosphatase (KDO 8-P phosphatase)
MAHTVSDKPEVAPGGRGFPEASVYRGLKLAAFDVDGVLTDGRICLNPQGLETNNFHVRDGSGLALLRHAGLQVAIVSGRKSLAVQARARELEIPPRRVWQGARHKRVSYQEMLAACGVRDAEVAYVGDDLVDLPILERVGLACCPCDAHASVIAACHAVAALPGGRGAVRQLCEHILKQRGPEVWEKTLRRYLGRE